MLSTVCDIMVFMGEERIEGASYVEVRFVSSARNTLKIGSKANVFSN